MVVFFKNWSHAWKLKDYTKKRLIIQARWWKCVFLPMSLPPTHHISSLDQIFELALQCILSAAMSQELVVLVWMSVVNLQHPHTLTDRHTKTGAHSQAYTVRCDRKRISHTYLHLYTNPPGNKNSSRSRSHTRMCNRACTPARTCSQDMHVHNYDFRNTRGSLNKHTQRQTGRYIPLHHTHTYTHILTHTHTHYTGGPSWRGAKAPSLLSLMGGPDKSNNLTGKQAIMFGQTYLRKALTILSLTQHTLLPPLPAPVCGFSSPNLRLLSTPIEILKPRPSSVNHCSVMVSMSLNTKPNSPQSAQMQVGQPFNVSSLTMFVVLQHVDLSI